MDGGYVIGPLPIDQIGDLEGRVAYPIHDPDKAHATRRAAWSCSAED